MMVPVNNIVSCESGSSREQEVSSEESFIPLPPSQDLAAGGDLSGIQAIEIDGEEQIEALIYNIFNGQGVDPSVQFFCPDSLVAKQIELRIRQEMQERLEREADNFFFERAEFSIKKELQPWKNPEAQSLNCLESTTSIPLSIIPPALLKATQGLLSDELPLFKVCMLQTVLDLIELRDLSNKGIITFKLPFNSLIAACAMLYTAPKIHWDTKLAAKRGLGSVASFESISPMTSKETSVALMHMLLKSLTANLSKAVPFARGKSGILVQDALLRFKTLNDIFWKRERITLANLRSTLGSICHDKSDPIYDKTPEAYLVIARDSLHKVRKFCAFILDAWEGIGQSSVTGYRKAVDFAFRRLEGALKMKKFSPKDLACLYQKVADDLSWLKTEFTHINHTITMPMHPLLTLSWGFDEESLKALFVEDSMDEALSASSSELSLLSFGYGKWLVKMAHEAVDLPCFAILRAFERAHGQSRLRIVPEKIEHFKMVSEGILGILENLCLENELLRRKILLINGSPLSLADFVEIQRNELKILDEIRLEAFASSEKVLYFGQSLLERFEMIIIPTLKHITKGLVDRLPALGSGEAAAELNAEELESFGKVLHAIDEFISVTDEKIPALEESLKDLLGISSKPPVPTASSKGKKPRAGKKSVKQKPKAQTAQGKKPPAPSVPSPAAPQERIVIPSSQEAEVSTLRSSMREPLPKDSLSVSSDEHAAPKAASSIPEKPKVDVHTYSDYRDTFLKSAKRLEAHISKKEMPAATASASEDYQSLKNVSWKDLVKELTEAGWAFVKACGGHLQYKHPLHAELGRATVPSGSKDALSKGVVKNVRAQIDRSRTDSSIKQ